MKKYCYDYPMLSVTADIIVIRKSLRDQILLIKRKHEPFQNHWALPGGFVEIDEDLENAAHRELAEETNIQSISLQQFKTYGTPGRDPRGRTVSIVFFGVIEDSSKMQAGDDAAELQWFNIDGLPPLAFDHKKIITEYFEK